MTKRVILLVLDSLGVGAMADTAQVRPQDQSANTFYHIIDKTNVKLPALEAMGINKILNHPKLERISPMASYGKLNLMHYGADSYAGHQEIMGTRPVKPLMEPFVKALESVKSALEGKGYDVVIPQREIPYLLVNGCVVVADNIETDYGQIYNVTGALDEISFEEVLKIGRIVRENVRVNRVIALGGENVGAEQIVATIERRDDGLVGVNSPRSGVYEKGYCATHLGYGVVPDNQISTILTRNQKEVILIGKMQDVIVCEGARKVPAVDTTLVMEEILKGMDFLQEGVIAATVQETDLAGHAQDSARYASKLQIVDNYLSKLLQKIKPDDMLIITADHGNDPTIGHSQHTREKTLLLVYGKKLKPTDLGERNSLSDIAATIAEYFDLEKPENGTGFFEYIRSRVNH